MKSWYVVHTKPRKESLAEFNLERQRFETYLPWMKRVRRRGNGWAEVIEPLFPRYLFLRLDPSDQNIAPIRSTLGVTALVTFGNRLIPVPESVIQMLRDSEASQAVLHTASKPPLETGDAVAIASGPFEGLCGIYEKPSGQERVAVLLDVLGRETRVILRRADISRATPTGVPSAV